MISTSAFVLNSSTGLRVFFSLLYKFPRNIIKRHLPRCEAITGGKNGLEIGSYYIQSENIRLLIEVIGFKYSTLVLDIKLSGIKNWKRNGSGDILIWRIRIVVLVLHVIGLFRRSSRPELCSYLEYFLDWGYPLKSPKPNQFFWGSGNIGFGFHFSSFNYFYVYPWGGILWHSHLLFQLIAGYLSWQ